MSNQTPQPDSADELETALLLGFLYGIQSDFLQPDETAHRVAGYKCTRGYAEAKQAIQAHVDKKVNEVLDRVDEPVNLTEAEL